MPCPIADGMVTPHPRKAHVCNNSSISVYLCFDVALLALSWPPCALPQTWVVIVTFRFASLEDRDALMTRVGELATHLREHAPDVLSFRIATLESDPKSIALIERCESSSRWLWGRHSITVLMNHMRPHMHLFCMHRRPHLYEACKKIPLQTCSLHTAGQHHCIVHNSGNVRFSSVSSAISQASCM